MSYYGRTVLFSNKLEITKDNVLDVVRKANSTHEENSTQIEYLYNYYKGKQPIIYRTKDVRPEICNKIVENRAYQIVNFKLGYMIGEPIAYVSRNDKEDVGTQVESLNNLCYINDKETQDVELTKWCLISGNAYRLVLPDENKENGFISKVLDPRNTFVVYASYDKDLPLLAGTISKKDDKKVISVYTKDSYYEIIDNIVTTANKHALNQIPIIEYYGNEERLGCFEPVLVLLDAINNLQSNRLDGVEQFIQALMVFKNVQLEEEMLSKLRDMGAIQISGDGSVDILTKELSQTQTQTLADCIYDNIIEICAIPSRNGSGSTSDTGSAVYMRDGYGEAEAQAKSFEKFFKRQEKQVLKLILFLCNNLVKGFNLTLQDIDIKFTRRNYENILQKTQVLTTLLNNDKIHPQLAFIYSGLFTDPDNAYRMSIEHYNQVLENEKLNQDEFNDEIVNAQKTALNEEFEGVEDEQQSLPTE